MKIIGLTGGIASGKSTVSRCLADLGAHIIDGDVIAHQIIEPGEPAYQAIIEHFGEQIIGSEGKIDRTALGTVVFNHPEELTQLNRITHPYIGKVIRQRIEQAAESDVRVTVLDLPLLFESRMEKMADEVWVVWVSPDVQLQRLIKRDQIDEKAARARIDSQMPLDEKRQRAQVVIDNNGTEIATCQQVTRFYNDLVTTIPRKMK
ncbi:MAG: dephospho-CoA kinase [Methylocystaceae bacterium]